MPIKNIIFDLDGTLIDSSDGVVEAVNYSLEKMGEAPQADDAIKPFIGYPLREMYPHFSSAPFEELYRYFQEKATETIISSTVILPGVENVIAQLKADGYKMAIASTKIIRHINGIVDKFQWQRYFSVVSGGDEVERVKPDPMIFRLTLERMKAKAKETVVIGDTINDVLAGKAVPMKVIAVASPYGNPKRVMESGPDHFVHAIGDIRGIIKNNGVE